MKVAGYKLNGYNATYEKTCFDVRGGYNGTKGRVLEVMDIDSGMTFVFETEEDIFKPQRQKTRVWRAKNSGSKENA